MKRLHSKVLFISLLRKKRPSSSRAANDTSTSALSAPALRVVGGRDVIDAELEWFFTMRESAMGQASNEQLLARRHPDINEERAEAVRASRRIASWLAAIGHESAGVLAAAYAPRPWPLALRKKLRRLTGIVVRLAAAERGWPEGEADQAKLEMDAAVWLELARAEDTEAAAIRTAEATKRFDDAFARFANVRGDGESAISQVGGAR